MNTQLRLLASVLAVATLLLIACSKDKTTTPTSPNNPNPYKFIDSSFVDIKWTPETVVFGETEQSAIVDNDSTYSYISFNSGNAKAKTLKVGDIIFIYGKALKKVAEVSESGGKITVITERARLNEAIKDGKIMWEKSLRFTPDLIQAVQIVSKYPTTQKVNGNEVEFEFPVGNGMKGKIKMTLNDERLDASCEISKKVGIASVKYAFDGYVQKMTSSGNIEYAGGELKDFKYSNKGIEGEITVSLTAAGSTADLLGAIELPFTIIKVPIMVLGIPCTVNLKILFVINTQLASIDASAFAKAKFKFNSETGVHYNGSDVGFVGSAGPFNIDSNKDSLWVGSSTAAGINFGFTFPRFELGILGEILVPYVQTGFVLGGSYTFGTKSCLTIDADFQGLVGYDFDFLGLLKTKGSKIIFDEKKNLKKSGQCD